MADAPDEAKFRSRFERASTASGHRIIVAEVDRQLGGVLRDRRGGGVGEALMRETEAWAARRNLASTALHTRIDCDKSRAFYERIGYRLKATSRLMGRDLA